MVGEGEEGTQGQGRRAVGRFPGGEAHSRVPAATANTRAANPAKGAAEPLLGVQVFVGYCSLLLRSWWPAAPPAKLDSSFQEVLGSTSFGGVWLAEAGVDLVVEMGVVGAGVEVVTWVVGARVVG